MNAPLRKPWTQEEFFAWVGHQDRRYEFDGFQPVAMTGGNANHSRITGNVNFSLRQRLRGGPCEPLGPDAGVSTIGEVVRYPDALVTCAKFAGDALTIPGVVVVFEVLSPSSARIDRIVKVREYAAVRSIRRYVILDATFVGVMVFERPGADSVWMATTLTGGDVLSMPEIGIEIPVAEFYANTDLGSGSDTASDALTC